MRSKKPYLWLLAILNLFPLPALTAMDFGFIGLRRATINGLTDFDGSPCCLVQLVRIPLHGNAVLGFRLAWDPNPASKDQGSFIGSEWRLSLFSSHVETTGPDKIAIHGPSATYVSLRKSADGNYTHKRPGRQAEEIDGVEGGYLFFSGDGVILRFEQSILRTITINAHDGHAEEHFDLTYASPLQPIGSLTRRSDGEAIITYTLQPTNEEGMMGRVNWGDNDMTFFTSDEKQQFHGYQRFGDAAQLAKAELNGEELIRVSYRNTDGEEEKLHAPEGGLNRIDIKHNQALSNTFGVPSRTLDGKIIEAFQAAFHPITEELYWINGDPYFLEMTPVRRGLRVKDGDKLTYYEKRRVRGQWQITEMDKEGVATITLNGKRRTVKGSRVELDAKNRSFEFFPGEG